MPVKRQRVIQAAEKLVQKGRLEAAIGEYRKVLREVPNDTRTLNRVGDLYLRLGRVDESVQLFRRAADHFSREGFFVKAIAIFKKIIRVDPTLIQIYESLADLYHRQGLLNEARSQYQVVADYHGQNGNVEAVIGIHRKLVQLDKDDPVQRLKLADLYQQAGRLPEALEQYRQIAKLMIDHDRIGEATRVYQRAVELDSGDLDFVTDALLDLRDHGHPAAAETVLEVAVRRNRDAEKLRGLLGLEPEAEAGAVAEPPAERTATEEPAEAPPAQPETREPLVDLRRLTGLEEEAPPVEEAPETPEASADPFTALEFEIELDELDGSTAESAPELAEPPVAAGPAGEIADAAGAVEEDESERASRLAEQALELMAEAHVLAAYGLDEKAVERFEQILALEPRNLEAYRRLIELHLNSASEQAVIDVFTRAREAVPADSDRDGWRPIEELVAQEGYRLEAGALLAPSTAAAESERIKPAPESEPESELVVELDPVGEPELLAEPVPEPVLEPELAAESAPEPVLEPEIEAEPVPEPVVEPELLAEPTPEPVVEPEPPAPEELPAEESAITWLENLTSGESQQPAAGEEMFGDEQQFFDLAAELEEELREEEERLGAEIAPVTEEQSLEEIVEGFKKGVADSLSDQDYDTHYNLGIAYREMGLLDEAIGEFQLAAKDPRYLVDCCSLLGSSFLEKGFGDLAVKWYRRGLDSPEITEEETLGLLYELGNLHAALGNVEEARKVFVEVYGVNSNYRDVVARLEELRLDG